MNISRLRQYRWIRFAAPALLVVVILAVWLLRPQPAPQLATTTVHKGDIENTVVASGTLEAAKLVSVGAQVSGRVESLKVGLGDVVKTGDLIAQIDSTTQNNAVKNAQAALDSTRAQRVAQAASLKQAELAFKRQQMMMASDATSRADYEAAQAALDAASAQLKQVDAQIAQGETALATAEANLGYTRITAPMDGTVVAVIAREGQTLNANQQAPTIIRLAQLDTLTVKAQISEADVIRVRPGMPVYFSILGDPDRRFHAKLRSVEPAPESIATESSSSSGGGGGSSSSSSSSAVYYNGLFDIDNPDGLLRIGMTAQVNIVLEQADDALLIPASAVQRAAPRGPRAPAAGAGVAPRTPDTTAPAGAPGEPSDVAGGPAEAAGPASDAGTRQPGRPATVRVLTPDGTIETRKVRIGIDNNINVQVIRGLEAGEKVVIGNGGAPAAPAQAPRPRRLRL